MSISSLPLISSLNETQQAILSQQLDQLRPDCVPFESTDQEEVEAAITRLYKRSGLAAPFFVWCDSPWQLAVVPFLLQLLVHRPEDDHRRSMRRRFGPPAAARLHGDLRRALWVDRWANALDGLLEQLTAEMEYALAYDSVAVADSRDLVPMKPFRWSRIGVPVGHMLMDRVGNVALEASHIVYERLAHRLHTELLGLSRVTRNQQIDPIKRLLLTHLWSEDGIFARLQDAPSPRTFINYGVPGSTVLAAELVKQVQGTIFAEIIKCFPRQSPAETRHVLPEPWYNVTSHISDALLSSLYSMVWGLWSNPQAVYYHVMDQVFGSEFFSQSISADLADFNRFRQGAFAYTLLSKVVFACRQPQFIRLDEALRLHCADDAAIRFQDGYSVHAMHGLRVPAELITEPGLLTVERIAVERNIELRRMLIERYGLAKYVEDSGAEVVDTSDYGTLYRKLLPNDEAIVMVKVRNSTQEPDGSFRDYFLRVPPEVTSARAAVAWTFGLNSDDYSPAAQS